MWHNSDYGLKKEVVDGLSMWGVQGFLSHFLDNEKSEQVTQCVKANQPPHLLASRGNSNTVTSGAPKS